MSSFIEVWNVYLDIILLKDFGIKLTVKQTTRSQRFEATIITGKYIVSVVLLP